MNYSLVTIRPQGFAHSNGFRELQESVGWALAALGHESNITENAFSETGHNVVFGAELVSAESTLPSNTTIYNLEQDTHPNFGNILKLGAKAAAVWEYSKVNIPHWERARVKAIHVPFGYTPNLTRIPKAENQDIDVFFSGWLTPRREKILTALRSHGLNVVAVDSCYGGSRDNLISRAKICLNINHDGRNRTNIQRLSFWLANKKCIVSETSSDWDDYKDLNGGLALSPYEDLVNDCLRILRSTPPDFYRQDFESQGFALFVMSRERKFVSTIAKALESQPAPNPILERYERGCKEGDMKEFLPWLKANARGNILEIGVRDGASTSALLLGIDKHGGSLESWDINDCSHLFNHPKWSFKQIDSKLPLRLENSYDMALVDGDHTREGYTADLNNCYRWVKPGGFIISHDINPDKTMEEYGGDFPSIAVGQIYYGFIENHGLTHFELPGKYGLGILIKR